MPKVSRVILALTLNSNYIGYWNYVSQIWDECFRVLPTLVFYGTAEEQQKCNLSSKHGEIIRLDRVPEVTVNLEREWACTWGLFYGASCFPDDICMLSGIDQIPLSGLFFDCVRQVPLWHEKYIIGFGDAYKGSYYPSSHHVARGSMFKKIYEMDDDWEVEVKKVFDCRHNFTTCPDVWGLDEVYSSHFLKRHMEKNYHDVEALNLFWHCWQPYRLERETDLSALDYGWVRQGRFPEWHGQRPFEANDQALVKRLAENIPSYSWS